MTQATKSQRLAPSRPVGTALRAAWRYRGYVLSAIKSEFKSRFSRSIIGTGWMILHPLAMAAIYAVVLSSVLRAKIPGASGSPYDYAVYLLGGLLVWTVFSEALTRGMNIFVANAAVLKSVDFPRLTLPLISAGIVMVNGLILFAAVTAIALLAGYDVWPAVLIVPIWLAIVTLFSTALGLILGVLRVYFPDVGEVVPIIVQLLFWLTPIVYPLSILGPPFDAVVKANPLTPIVGQVQRIYLDTTTPDLSVAVWSTLIGLVLLALAWWLFRRTSRDIVDML